MITTHRIYFGDASAMKEVAAGSVQLAVTSPPYPMIEMWDEAFRSMDPAIGGALRRGDGARAYELMHEALARVWRELDRALASSGIACINVGDATRALDGAFRLYPNHVRVADFFLRAGYDALPPILWRKPSNKPNKFLGSGMLPPNAYVTLEHEHILVFRKGGSRPFAARDGARRRSAYFWEERNAWFSDAWEDLKGVPQRMSASRDRSAAYPFELPYRLINMFSVQGDLVLDPFLGTGTTALAAMAAGRSSAGYEIDPALAPAIEARLAGAIECGRAAAARRLSQHEAYMLGRPEARYRSKSYGFPVTTAQETDILIPIPGEMRSEGNGVYTICYEDEKFPGLKKE